MNQSEVEANTCSRHHVAQENTHEQVTSGFDFASHWLRKWRKFCEPITERSKGKPSLYSDSNKVPTIINSYAANVTQKSHCS